MKSVALVGPLASGKTTVFKALCPNAVGNVGVVEIEDERLDRIAEVVSAEKITSARVHVLDTDKAPLTQAREADSIAIVVSGWGGSDLASSLEGFRTDCVIADIATLEKSIARVSKKSGVKKDEQIEAEIRAYEMANKMLSDGVWLAEAKMDDAERRLLHLIGLVTVKPYITIINEAEDASDGAAQLEGAVGLKALLEAEVAQLSADDAAEFLKGYGLESSARQVVVGRLVELLDLIFFFTANKKEARSWEIVRGTKAPKAAGSVHTDFEKGFIRWEAVDYPNFLELGSWDKARTAGKLRVEGKDYTVLDGDVVSILHS